MASSEQAEVQFGLCDKARKQALFELDTGDEDVRYRAALRLIRQVDALKDRSTAIRRSDPGWALQHLDDAFELAIDAGAIERAGAILDEIRKMVPVVYPGDEAFDPLFKWHLKTWERKSLHLLELTPKGANVCALEGALKQYPGCRDLMKRLGQALIQRGASDVEKERGRRLIARARALSGSGQLSLV